MTSPELPHEHADVYSEEGYYAVVPEWVLDAEISAQAVRLYAVLRRYADQRTMFAHPSRRTLAGRIKVKDAKVVDRALVELQEIGAVQVIARWRDEAGGIAYAPDSAHRERTSNGYRLRRAPVQTEGRGGGVLTPTPWPLDRRGRGSGATGVGAEKGEKPQPPNHSQGDHRTNYVGGSHVSSGPGEQPPQESQAEPPAAPDAYGPEPSQHCAGWPHPPRSCPPCGDARRAHEAWADAALMHARAVAAVERGRQREARALADAERRDCVLCADDDGFTVVIVEGAEHRQKCCHDDRRNQRAVINRLATRAALDAARSAS